MIYNTTQNIVNNCNIVSCTFIYIHIISYIYMIRFVIWKDGDIMCGYHGGVSHENGDLCHEHIDIAWYIVCV